MAMQQIGKFSLKNQGGYVAKIKVDYIDDNGQRETTGAGPDITLGFTGTEDPGSLGVSDGDMVWLHVDVVAGYDNIAKQGFIYKQGSPVTAYYSCAGTTLDNSLGLDSVG